MEESKQSGTTHRVYEERQPSYNQLPDSTSGGQSLPLAGSAYDDEFVEMVAQRLAQRLIEAQKLQAKGSAPSPGQRLTLAIVSLVVLFVILVSMFGIASATSGGWIVLPVTLVVAIAVCIVNIVFGISHR
ncbi:MAG TPA: hypothetical protein VFB12_23400 [Ktedonobacteraceae bacterium]|nr:hypothetical protein [Ktedonobacteraceae bacterium]